MNRSDRALLLTVVAAAGLIVTPLLHAEEHVCEQREDGAEASAAADAWRAGSTDPLERLAFALEHVHDTQPTRAREQRHGEPRGHSHGPAGSGPHGSNTLAHLGLALHWAAQVATIDVPAAQHASPADIESQLHGAHRYLFSEWSQGPPIGC